MHTFGVVGELTGLLLRKLSKLQYPILSVEISEIASLKGISYVFLCVDISMLWQVIKSASPFVQSGCCVIIRSKAPVGTGDAVQDWFHREGKDLEVIICPLLADEVQPSRLVLGGDLSKPGIHMIRRWLSDESMPVIITNRKEAEIIRYAESCMLSLKSAFVHQIAQLCEVFGGDAVNVLRVIGIDPEIGQTYLEAGIGPLQQQLLEDIRSLLDQARNVGIQTALLNAIMDINEQQNRWIIHKVKEKYASLHGLQIAVWGEIQGSGISELLSQGAILRIDDKTELEQIKSKYGNENQILWCTHYLDTVDGADVLVILSKKREYIEADLSEVKQRLKIPYIVDGRSIFPGGMMKDLGFEYISVGRKV